MVPEKLTAGYPRMITNALSGKADLYKLLKEDAAAQRTYDAIIASVEPYVLRHATDTTWIVSRLQMFWRSHATDVYIKNGVFAYAAGRAPVPTVRFTGTRDAATAYFRPKLEDIKPYMDDNGKVFLQSKSTAGQPWEWVEQSKTGRIIESINIEIMTKARDAALVYWLTGDERYGKFAYDLLKTYLVGMYHRNEPIDLNKGHDQTIVGLSSFEVIHEDILEPVTACYDLLHNYISEHHGGQLAVFDRSLKKWAEIIIKNGVPFNNWNLIEARFIFAIAMVLNDDEHYHDKRGRRYYLDLALNQTQTRQWAIKDLLQTGYDKGTGIWFESPGYAVGVLGDFTGYLNFFERTLNIDLLPGMPVLKKAVTAQAQYLFPNGYIVGFGDTHYSRVNTGAIEHMIRNARAYHRPADELYYTRFLKAMRAISGASAENRRGGFNSLFGSIPLRLSDTIQPGELGQYLTPTFWSPNVGWVVQRNGTDTDKGLMISQAGSAGNHAHANGIAMELYGKGLILGPESGIGGSYFQNDYAEYYSQFPAHNTVVVDGLSAYPVMRSNHPLTLAYCYPRSGVSSGFFPGTTLTDVNFLEPETNADQNRVMSIVRNSDTSGYYVDIFRSQRKDGKDRTHDYIYHNLGQDLRLFDDAGKPLHLQPTNKLTFADYELIGYDYWWDKRSLRSAADLKARFDLQIPNGKSVSMNVWIKGYPEREVFSVKAPPSRAFRPNEIVPDSISNMPLPTLVVRQSGQAWTRPFVAVYEPSNGKNGSSISKIYPFSPPHATATFVGLCVESKGGSIDHIFNDKTASDTRYKDMAFEGTYGTIRVKAGKLVYLFLGNGHLIGRGDYRIHSSRTGSAALELRDGSAYFTCDQPTRLTLALNGRKARRLVVGGRTVKAERTTDRTVTYAVPATSWTELRFLD